MPALLKFLIKDHVLFNEFNLVIFLTTECNKLKLMFKTELRFIDIRATEKHFHVMKYNGDNKIINGDNKIIIIWVVCARDFYSIVSAGCS